VPVIGALVGEGSIRDEITRQLARLGEIEFCSTTTAAVEAGFAGRIDVLLTTLRDEQGASVARAIPTLSVRAPRVPVLLYDHVTRSTVNLLGAMLVPGLRMDCVVRPFEPLVPLVQQTLAGTLPPVVAPILLQRLLRVAPTSLAPFVCIAALKATSHRGLDQLARWSGVTPRTIERRLARARWAPVHVLLQSCRALDVLWLMTQYGWSVRKVQRARGVQFASAITRLTQRYAGTTPRDVREGIDFRAVLDDVLERITTPSAARNELT
jgi:hypothetical protein